jgi:hypothetical protein
MRENTMCLELPFLQSSLIYLSKYFNADGYCTNKIEIKPCYDRKLIYFRIQTGENGLSFYKSFQTKKEMQIYKNKQFTNVRLMKENKDYYITFHLERIIVPKQKANCCICFDTMVCYKFFDCQHIQVCNPCHKKMQENICPLCRG